MPFRLNPQKPSEFLPKAYFLQSIERESFANFTRIFNAYKANFADLSAQNEDSIVANALNPFCANLGFATIIKEKQDGNSQIDLAIMKDKSVQVIIEAKTPENRAEFFSDSANLPSNPSANPPSNPTSNPESKTSNPSNPTANCKALHEAILYYFREREGKTPRGKPNIHIKFIIITNFTQFFIFKDGDFADLFYADKNIRAIFARFNKATKDFYDELKKYFESPAFLSKSANLNCLKLDINDESHAEIFYKIFHRDFLLCEFKNELAKDFNEHFYAELLHILGLRTAQTNGKIIIIPSQVRNTIYDLICARCGKSKAALDESVMKLIIIWLNRILFLKLIEANLVNFASKDSRKDSRFFEKINDFSDLGNLFFNIFAKTHAQRENGTFHDLPYLNSSLFDEQQIERDLMRIANLDEYKDAALSKFSDLNAPKIPLFKYLKDFLNSYNFGDKKDKEKLISASVLGKIFERINGYKDGAVYTDGNITSFMCKESLERVVLAKFNARFGFQCEDLRALRRRIDRDFDARESDFKSTLKSIKICDPAVGSGHFLVSALNEMVRIHAALGLLDFKCGGVEILNDELAIANFAYKRDDLATYEIQKGLFNLKKDIIENCLFGVDINPNSVEICKLRLWIELLKNSYYLRENDENFTPNLDSKIHQMQTLPNIDINIKCGNSLISRFALFGELKSAPNIKHKVREYKNLVRDYKDSSVRDLQVLSKDKILAQIADIKESFKLTLKDSKAQSEIQKAIDSHIAEFGRAKLNDEILLGFIKQQHFADFEGNLSESQIEKAIESAGKIRILREKLDLKLSGEEFKNAFEWRFEFPEVLDENGDFLGFDLVIGNPPYIRQEELGKSYKSQLNNAFKNLANFGKFYCASADILTYFFPKALDILKPHGELNFIVSNKFCRAGYGENLRRFLLENANLLHIVDLNGLRVFENVTVDVCIIAAKKAKSADLFTFQKAANKAELRDLAHLQRRALSKKSTLNISSFLFLNEEEIALKSKIEAIGAPLKSWDISIYRGVLTGYNEAFIIDSAKKDAILNACKDEDERARTKALLKPILRGRDIKRYAYEWAGLWLIGTFPALHLEIDEFPALKAFLENFMPRIKQSGEQGCRKKTSNKWFETSDQIAYWQNFEREKIVYPNMNKELLATLDRNQFYTNQKCFIVVGKNLAYLTAFLNSKAMFWYFKQIGATLGSSGYEMSKIFIEKLPIPK